jgi:predicted dinucleotide-binding enzyme
MKIAVIGHGQVGGALAVRLLRLGHDVVVGARDAGSGSLARLVEEAPGIRVATLAEAAREAAVVVLATPFPATTDLVKALAAELAGKVVVDCTNPVGAGLTHGLGSRQSGTELLQSLAPGAKLVKAFSVYGYENFEDSRFPGAGVLPAMPFCGEDPSAKSAVAALLTELGWEPVDVGGAGQALHLEHMTLLWIRMVRMGGRSPHTVWALLSR